MPGKLIIAVLLRLLSLYERRNVVYIANSVPTPLFIIQSHRHGQALSISKEELNAAGRNNKIAPDNGVPEY